MSKLEAIEQANHASPITSVTLGSPSRQSSVVIFEETPEDSETPSTTKNHPKSDAKKLRARAVGANAAAIRTMTADRRARLVECFERHFSRGDGCWVWTGIRTKKGYGMFDVLRRRTTAHRVAFELWVGPVPDGLVIDHLCKNRSCVRPDHLEAVTDHENNARSSSPAAFALRTGLCRTCGGQLSPRKNRGKTTRYCVKCNSARAREWNKAHPEYFAAYYQAKRRAALELARLESASARLAEVTP